jgi:hypothetical protein
VSTNDFGNLVMGKPTLAKANGLVAQLLLRLRCQLACISFFGSSLF